MKDCVRHSNSVVRRKLFRSRRSKRMKKNEWKEWLELQPRQFRGCSYISGGVRCS